MSELPKEWEKHRNRDCPQDAPVKLVRTESHQDPKSFLSELRKGDRIWEAGLVRDVVEDAKVVLWGEIYGWSVKLRQFTPKEVVQNFRNAGLHQAADRLEARHRDRLDGK